MGEVQAGEERSAATHSEEPVCSRAGIRERLVQVQLASAIGEQHLHLSRVLRGHFAYYGISGNSRRLRWYAHQVERIWKKWLSRRGQPDKFRWTRLRALLKRHPLPSVKIVHCYTVGSETLQ